MHGNFRRTWLESPVARNFNGSDGRYSSYVREAVSRGDRPDS